MTEIYLIRHMQAEGNLFRVMQGHYDGAVTPLGLRQAELLGERFRGVPFDALYSSDLSRARLTAEALQPSCPLPLRTDPRLREIHVGRWEARFFGDLQHEEPESIAHYLLRPGDWQMDGAETYRDVAERVAAAMEEIARRHEGQRVAVVSHGVAIRCLLARLLDLDVNEPDRLPIALNTAVSRLLYENGRWSADYLNDASHLDALQLPAWERSPTFWAEPLDPRREADYYTSCYADAWRAAHGSLLGYEPEPYLDGAVEHRRADPGAVLKIWCGDEPAGLVDLDTRRGAFFGCGWVSLLYLAPAYRRRGCGVQLLGRAVMRYRELGRRALRLHVAESNADALAFYRKQGFTELSHEQTGLGRLLLMEKKLGGPRHV
ncbi:MAG: GNAT family N-acetyltransferase [Oscillospiraceae bacterium]|nr:GNAT family N-acetyltransferase [Oscillospiraceae bacterium]